MKTTFTEQTINNMSLDELVHYIDNGDIPCHPAILAMLQSYITSEDSVEQLEAALDDMQSNLSRMNSAMDLIEDALESAETDEEAVEQARKCLIWIEAY